MGTRTAPQGKSILKRRGARTGHQIWILAITVLLLNINTLSNGFTLDDRTLVLEDPRTSDMGHVGEIMGGGYRLSPLNSLYRPLTVLSFAVNRAIAGDGASGFHLVNILLHLVAVLLAFRLGSDIFGNRLASFFAALAFAVHPVHVEAVANVVGRAEIMAAISVFGSLILLLKHHPKKWGESWPTFAAALILYMAGLLAKESAIVLVGLWALLRFSLAVGKSLPVRLRSVILDYRLWSLMTVSLAYIGIRQIVLGHNMQLVPLETMYVENPLAFEPTQTRLLTAVLVLAKYVWLLFWPFTLSADYSYHVIPLITRASNPVFLVGISFYAALACAALYLARRRPVFLICFAFFLVSISVVSNLLIPIGATMAERFLYLPSVAFCWAVGAMIHGADVLPDERSFVKARPVWAVVLLLLLSSWAIRTYTRNVDWRNDQTLMEATLRTFPESSKAHVIMGDLLVARRDFTLAEREYQKALEIYPGNAAAAINRAGALDFLKRHRESIELLQGFAGKSGSLEVGRLRQLAIAFIGVGDYPQAAASYESALRLKEADPMTHRNLGAIYFDFLKEPEKGLAHVRRSLELDPQQPGADRLRAILQTQGKTPRRQ